MGRWSARLAPAFLEVAAIGNVRKVLDVGCGTGSLTLALAEAAPRATIVGIDLSQAFVDHARTKSSDARLTFEQGDAAALGYGDETFDAALSLLVLNFIADAEKAATEMRRVTKPGGVVAASVWDFRGGLPYYRIVLDTAAVLDPIGGEALRARVLSAPLVGPGELASMWAKLGLREIEHTSLTMRMEFRSFADYWQPWLGGQGMIGPYVAGLDDARRALVERHVRLGYLAGSDDGPRSFAATAWVVRGTR